MNELVKIGALWCGQDKNGNTMFSGKLGDARLLVFSNTGENKNKQSPDYNVYVTKPEPREAQDQGGRDVREQDPYQAKPQRQTKEEPQHTDPDWLAGD